MPYIKSAERAAIDNKIDTLAHEIKLLGGTEQEYAGRLNYAVTRLIIGVMGEVKYWKIALYCGVLSNIATEFYRRVAVPYEDKKIAENGDVHGYDSGAI